MSVEQSVLLLEDQSNWQNTVRMLLESQKDVEGKKLYAVEIADSLTGALTLLKSRVFDVAIVDICLVEGDLANTDGIIFLDEIGKYYHDDRTHAVMLSGHGTVSLAVDAVKRNYVLDFFEKGAKNFNSESFLLGVATACRATMIAREERERMQFHKLPQAFFERLGLAQLATSLAPEMDLGTAKGKLETILRSLLVKYLPLAPDLKTVIREDGDNLTAHVLCWSRQLVRPLDAAIGRSGTHDILQPAQDWKEALGSETVERLDSWSIPSDFDGILFGLPPNINIHSFLSMVTKPD